jgi:hypothetical protein
MTAAASRPVKPPSQLPFDTTYGGAKRRAHRRRSPPSTHGRRGVNPTTPRRWPRCAVAHPRGTEPQPRAAGRPATRRRPPRRHGEPKRGRGVRRRQQARGARPAVTPGAANSRPDPKMQSRCSGKSGGVRAPACCRRRSSRITSTASRAATPPARHPLPRPAVGSAAKSIDAGDLFDGPLAGPIPGARGRWGFNLTTPRRWPCCAVTPLSGTAPQRRATGRPLTP